MVHVVRATAADIETAVATLRNGDVVAFPTETVYALGANAADPRGVARVFELKQRPTTHPLIVHVDQMRFLHRWVREMPSAAERLAAKFWPGPMTLVLPRQPQVLDLVTGGQDTVAVRIPAHPMAQQLLTAFGGGIAAPSANRYGRISATRADHVREEFGDGIRILDGGDCQLGIESTIVAFVDGQVRLLRPGSITRAQIEAEIGPIVVGAAQVTEAGTADTGMSLIPRVPGSDASHYAPETPLQIVLDQNLDARVAELAAADERVAVLAQRPARRALRQVTWTNAGRNVDRYTRDLYAHLRRLDNSTSTVIVVQAVPGTDAWAAVRDRLQRASAATPAPNAP